MAFRSGDVQSEDIWFGISILMWTFSAFFINAENSCKTADAALNNSYSVTHSFIIRNN